MFDMIKQIAAQQKADQQAEFDRRERQRLADNQVLMDETFEACDGRRRGYKLRGVEDKYSKIRNMKNQQAARKKERKERKTLFTYGNTPNQSKSN